MLELAVTLALLVAAFAVRRVSVHDRADWTGGVLLDHRARALLRARTGRARRTAARLSDVGFWTLLLYPGWFDGLLVVGAMRGERVLAARVFVMDLQAFAALAVVMFVMQRWVARERPYASHPEVPPYEPVHPERFRSFFSGHAATAFAGATLVWLHELYLPGYGTGWHLAAALLSCLLAVGVALLRVRADRHWLSDVMAGAVVGTACGWLVPMAVHGLPGRLLHLAR